jgi:hypothetical protein
MLHVECGMLSPAGGRDPDHPPSLSKVTETI